MRLLLDTHVLLWWMQDDKRLGKNVCEQIMDESIEIFISAATIWEMSIKRAKGRLDYDTDELYAEMEKLNFQRLNVTYDHAEASGELPLHNNDPFDRLIVAQARVEGLDLVTYDKALKPYGVPVLRRK